VGAAGDAGPALARAAAGIEMGALLLVAAAAPPGGSAVPGPWAESWRVSRDGRGDVAKPPQLLLRLLLWEPVEPDDRLLSRLRRGEGGRGRGGGGQIQGRRPLTGAAGRSRWARKLRGRGPLAVRIHAQQGCSTKPARNSHLVRAKGLVCGALAAAPAGRSRAAAACTRSMSPNMVALGLGGMRAGRQGSTHPDHGRARTPGALSHRLRAHRP
jgi:hypothetical protein